MSTRYRIDDEPVPSRLSQIACDPFWPLLALMLAGGWLGWPWFAINGMAMGSATRGREVALVVAGFVGSIVMWIATIAVMQGAGTTMDRTAWKLVFFTVTLWQLAIGYLLHQKQSRSIQLFQYFGGNVRNGFIVLAVGAFFLDRHVGKLLADSILAPVLR